MSQLIISLSLSIMYTHLFFDLDHTLWDFDRNSAETLQELFVSFSLGEKLDCTVEEFTIVYSEVIKEMWALYDQKLIDKDTLRHTRFDRVFARFGFQDKQLSLQINEEYLSICPRKPHLIKHAQELLEYLAPKYPMSLLTNGFKESQQLKIHHSGLKPFFTSVVTSECSGFSKPDERMFHYALEKAKAKPEHCLMIGDNPFSDIEGARRVRIDQVFFNPSGAEKTTATFEIGCLSELKKML